MMTQAETRRTSNDRHDLVVVTLATDVQTLLLTFRIQKSITYKTSELTYGLFLLSCVTEDTKQSVSWDQLDEEEQEAALASACQKAVDLEADSDSLIV